MSSVVEPITGHDVPRSAADGPQLRTILLTDLVESTALVEQLGDGPAAELFREHDRLVVELQQQWRGRLIDRSDGLLLLFERAIDGLGFALDYNRGLLAIGASRKVTLQARTGLHVGEVLSWRNSDVAVSLGAKPLEVEGLAKPFAARLMTLARPGQILLSAVAEPLAHRAARELGERGEQLLWKSYGRWCFKGIPEAQEIYEVGEAGIAPLRAPKSTAKSWRDIPFWRRPAALGAELLLVAGLATGTWFLTRPQPAIAFGERDWVVVGDLRNLTGDKLLDDSLQQAFRISLEQSRFVNVLSDLKSRDTLALMQRKPGTALDRAIASEIALRDGARAVILPTVSEVGGRVRVSAEVIDPHTQTTVYAESADGTGAASTLDSIDTVTAALRGKLGEALESVEKTSEPLPQVATNNLDALRAYALGQRAYFKGDYADAAALYQRATSQDQQFAMAWLGQGRALYAQLGMTAASSPLRRAQALRNRLPPREAMYLDGWAAELEAPATALEKWRLMAKLYPDSVPANVNTAIRLMKTGYWKDELPFAERGTAPQSELIGFSFDLLGRGLMALGDTDKAAYAFDRAVAGGFRDSQERRAEIAAIRRKFSAARRLLEPLSKTEPDTHLEQMTFAVDEAQWQDAQHAAASALQFIGADGRYALAARFAQASVDGLAGDVALARQRNAAVASASLRNLAANETAADADEAIGVALSSALLGLQWGDREQAQQVLSSIEGNQHAQTPRLSELATVVRAEMLRLDGQSQEAIKLLMPLLTGNESYQTHRVLMEAYATAGETAAAVKQAEWLQGHRGLAYAETIGYHCRQSWNVATNTLAWLRGAELLTKLDEKAEARKMLAGFDLRWPPERLPDYLRARREAVLAASRAGGV